MPKTGKKALGYIYETNRILKSAFEQENNIGTLMDKRNSDGQTICIYCAFLRT